MGAALLSRRRLAAALTASALALAPATGPSAAQERPGPGEGDPHGDLACATCHRTPVAGREVGGVPEAACTEAGCHRGGGPARVSVSTVTFRHRDHGDTASVTLGCAGCHGHASGGDPVEPTLSACALCHADRISSERPSECLTCHQEPRHTPVTPQGVPVPHAELPWVVEGCTRCHYDVARPRTSVPITACRDCHADLRSVTEAGIGRDLHPSHEVVGCTTCHAKDLHRVVAMSSSVRLACGDCHVAPHGADLLGGTRGAADVCAACHDRTHALQQRMVLGLVPELPVTPAYKFRAGLTCRSCHAEAGEDERAEPSLPATVARACRGCHLREYARVLTWWEEGARQRLARVRSYRSRAARELAPAADSAAVLLGRAEALAAFVDSAGPAHNVRLADAALRESAERVRAAYRAAGREPPASPDLGRRPRVGFCSYCHYRIGEPTGFDEIPEDFHEEVTRRLERLRGGEGG